MNELIEALQIFLKYGDVKYPFVCEHDKLYVVGYDAKKFSSEDIERLKVIGFNIYFEGEPFDKNYPEDVANDNEISSYKYGSA